MENNERCEDKALCIIMRHEAEASEQIQLSDDFSDRLMQRILDEEKKKRGQKRRQVWMYVGIAAAVAAIMMVLMAPPKSQEDDATPKQQVSTFENDRPKGAPIDDTIEVIPNTFLAVQPSDAASMDDIQYDQNDLISVDSVFGVTSCADPQAEYTALNEKLTWECEAVFEMIENQQPQN